jgi:SSS family solute:Na+ symporter
LNAAFALRGLTSGALVGGLALAVFWKKGRSIPVITGMIVSLATMTAIQLLPKLDCTKAFWMKTVGTEIFWPWYTLIGATITLLTAWLVRTLLPSPGPSSDTPAPASAPPATG